MGKKRTKVLQFKLLEDERGRYMPYCNSSWHRGYIETPEICKERRCVQYYEIRINIPNSLKDLSRLVKGGY